MHDLIAPYVERGLVTKKKHPTRDLYNYDYTMTTQIEKAWDDVTELCRGLVLDGEGSIVSRPFKKFRNVEEHEGLLPPLDQAEIYDKLDGSLVIVSRDRWAPVISTRGSFTSPQARSAHDLLDDGYGTAWVEAGYTYLFEFTAAWNRIVVNHGDEEKLTLLAKIETATGREEDVTFVHEWTGPRVPRCVFFDESQLTWENLKADRDNHEGWVLFWRDRGLRLKVKHSQYLYQHRIATRTNAVDVWECLRQGIDPKTLLDGLPDESFPWLRETELRLRLDVLKVTTEAEKTFAQLIAPHGHPPQDRREFAMLVQRCGFPHKAILFRLWDDQDYDDLAWKAIKPKKTSPFLDSRCVA